MAPEEAKMRSNAMKSGAVGAMLFGGTLGATSAAEAGLVIWNCNIEVSQYLNGAYNYGLNVNIETQKYNNDTAGGNVGNNGGGLTNWDLLFQPNQGSKLGVIGFDPANGLVSSGVGVARLASGTVLGNTLAGGMGYNQGISLNTQVGGAYEWTAGSTGYFGFQFKNAAGQIRYGWGELALNAGSRQEGTIVQFVYDDSGAAVTTGVVPAPGAAALLGLAGLVARRRRRG
jgi:MYXO-CTERM domain-containing protein